MKSQAQNTKEVMDYLKKSSQHFFESEDGNYWQSVVYLHAVDKYVLIKNDGVYELPADRYTGTGMTEGKTLLKRRVHPNWEISDKSSWYNGYGHGTQKKIRAVRWNKARLELTSTAAQTYLAAQTEKGSV